MKLFLDSSRISEIKKWDSVISGVTTNPSILLKEGGDINSLLSIMRDRPVSVEASGNFLDDARYFAKLAPNVVVKVPLLNPAGGDNLSLIRQLAGEGIPVNCTALFSLPQVMLATEVGSRYVSVFGGRVDDEGGDDYYLMRDCMRYLGQRLSQVYDTPFPRGDVELIVGSVRSIGQVVRSSKASCDIITRPPSILEKMVEHSFSRKTSEQFERDAQSLKSKGAS